MMIDARLQPLRKGISLNEQKGRAVASTMTTCSSFLKFKTESKKSLQSCHDQVDVDVHGAVMDKVRVFYSDLAME